MATRRLNKRYVLMLRWGIPCAMAAVVLSFVVVLGSVRKDPAAPAADGSIAGLTSVLSRKVTSEMVRFAFEPVTEEAGIRFRHFPAKRRSMLPEDMGSGLAWGDYDDDGDVDLFLVNFRASILDGKDVPPGRCALYRNEGGGRFLDVSAAAGLDLASFGMAAAWADYDNDDDLDLYVTGYGANVLFRNDGDPVAPAFTDVTAESGTGDEGFGAGCAWADFDRDGHVDLYVCNYVEFEYRPGDRSRSTRQYGSEIPYTINPSAYPPSRNRLFHNNGDGTFTDVAGAAGVANETGRSLGAAWFDFDSDGWIDLYVANDVSANGVFRNMGDGTFADIGAASLAADYRGAMGMAVGDYEHDGDLDLFVTHWIAQENAFFENMASEGLTDAQGSPRLFFMDRADTLGLGQISLRTVGWATGLVDLDNDGFLDLWTVNGNTLEDPQDHAQLKPQHLHLFRQQSPHGFFEMAAQACPILETPFVGRGGAHADFDGDGRVDLALVRHGGEPLLLHNTSPETGHWVVIRLRQAGGNTRALGARIEVRAGVLRTAQVGAGGAYLSQHQTDVHFGLGAADTIDEIVIHWPDGMVESTPDVDVDQVVTFRHAAEYP